MLPANMATHSMRSDEKGSIVHAVPCAVWCGAFRVVWCVPWRVACRAWMSHTPVLAVHGRTHRARTRTQGRHRPRVALGQGRRATCRGVCGTLHNAHCTGLVSGRWVVVSRTHLQCVRVCVCVCVCVWVWVWCMTNTKRRAGSSYRVHTAHVRHYCTGTHTHTCKAQAVGGATTTANANVKTKPRVV